MVKKMNSNCHFLRITISPHIDRSQLFENYEVIVIDEWQNHHNNLLPFWAAHRLLHLRSANNINTIKLKPNWKRWQKEKLLIMFLQVRPINEPPPRIHYSNRILHPSLPYGHACREVIRSRDDTNKELHSLRNWKRFGLPLLGHLQYFMVWEALAAYWQGRRINC